MATIYQKTDTLLGTKNALILGSREAMFRPFNFGAWTEVRIGLYASFTLLNNNNSTPVSENVTWASYLDTFAFGLNADAATIPGQTGNYFIGHGIAIGTGNPNANAVSLQGSSPWRIKGNNINSIVGFTSLNGVMAENASDSTSSFEWGTSSAPINPASYAGFVGLRFVVSNAGLATQTIQVYSSWNSDDSNPYTLASLKSELLAFSNNIVNKGVGQWNTGSAALALPSYFYLRSSLLSNQIRVHAYEAIKIS